MAIVLSARWTAKPGEERTVRDALRYLAPASREEEGCLFYQVYQDPHESGTFHIFEMYTDDAALAAHGESPHFQKWGTGVALTVLATRERALFQTLDF